MNKTINIIYFDTEVNLIDAVFLTFTPCLVQHYNDNAELHCRSCHGEAEAFGSWVGDSWSFWHLGRHGRQLGIVE